MSTKTPAQADLLEQIADKIQSEPQLWNQRYFSTESSCGTTHCIAGWAQTLSETDDLLTEDVTWTDLLGFNGEEVEFVFYRGFLHTRYEHSHKEVAEWLRAIARGEDVFETAPEWWES